MAFHPVQDGVLSQVPHLNVKSNFKKFITTDGGVPTESYLIYLDVVINAGGNDLFSRVIECDGCNLVRVV